MGRKKHSRKRTSGRTAKTNIVPLAKIEKQAILAALKVLRGDKILAARKLGIGKTTLYRKLKDYRYKG